MDVNPTQKSRRQEKGPGTAGCRYTVPSLSHGSDERRPRGWGGGFAAATVLQTYGNVFSRCFKCLRLACI